MTRESRTVVERACDQFLRSLRERNASPHTIKAYGCSTSGRCDTLALLVTQATPPVTYSMDDSVPEKPDSVIRFTTMPGALPKPPTAYQGCPQHQGDPDIKLTAPLTYSPQAAFGGTSAGNIFFAKARQSELMANNMIKWSDRNGGRAVEG